MGIHICLSVTTMDFSNIVLFSQPTANGTDDGVYDMNTGVDDIHKLGIINSWNGDRYSTVFH